MTNRSPHPVGAGREAPTESPNNAQLTGLFELRLAALLSNKAAPGLAVLIIRLDDFRTLNESFGRVLAYKVLDLAVERVESALRKLDKLLRLPDDEFAILLDPPLTLPETSMVAERLIDLLQRAYFVRGQIVNSSASIGIAVAPQHGKDSETLLKHAGMALQRAQSSGPGSVQFFQVAIEERILARRTMAMDLRKALLLHQLEVHYQPQVDIADQHLTGFEALLRWNHPQRGWISPGDFIPLAEENGMIGTIGDWVLHTACIQAARLPKNILVAVNASPLQFRTGSFAESVAHALSIAEIPSSQLEIEITESVLMQKSKAVLETLHDLRSMGVRLAMDDFGTGYSSLGQLAKFPFNTIKIDRSLIMDVPTQEEGAKQRAIVRAIATLGKGLGMCTLVEGIETEEQLANAFADGCVSAQGYLFGKAAPAKKLDEIISALSCQVDSSLELTQHS